MPVRLRPGTIDDTNECGRILYAAFKSIGDQHNFPPVCWLKTSSDRLRFVLLISRVQNGKERLLILKPDTLLCWHRKAYWLFCKLESRSRTVDGAHYVKAKLDATRQTQPTVRKLYARTMR